MLKTTIRQLFKDTEKFKNELIEVSGWVRTIRDSKTFGFIELNDGSFFKNIQIVFDQSLSNFEDVTKLTVSSSIKIVGNLIMTPDAKQLFEVKATQVEVKCISPADYPLQKKQHSFEYLRTIAHLRPRTNTFSAVFRVRSLLAYAIHKFFQEKDFIYVHTPIITSIDAESAGEMFHVTTTENDFFGRQAYLSVSGQLNGEAFASAYNNIYTFGPTFRAENSNTTRHASEFWMIEPEMAFADLNDNMQMAEDMIKYIIKYVIDNAPDEMEFFNKFIDIKLLEKLNNVMSSEFGKITYSEAIGILEKNNDKFQYQVHWGSDIQTEHERYICEVVFKKPVFVIDYPKEIKSFYMKLNDDQKTVKAMDLLAPGIGEIMGGSQREEDYEILKQRIIEFGLEIKDYDWYLDLRKYGSVIHSGYGLGFERMLMYITGIQNIRDAIPFPRTPNSCDF